MILNPAYKKIIIPMEHSKGQPSQKIDFMSIMGLMRCEPGLPDDSVSPGTVPITQATHSMLRRLWLWDIFPQNHSLRYSTSLFACQEAKTYLQHCLIDRTGALLALLPLIAMFPGPSLMTRIVLPASTLTVNRIARTPCCGITMSDAG